MVLPGRGVGQGTKVVRINSSYATRPFSFRRTRIQAAVAILLVLLQYLALVTFSSAAADSIELVYSTAAGCILATGLGIFFLRGVGQYPGVEESVYMIPGFCASYGLLLLTFILGRLEYSRILLTSSFIVNIVFFLGAYSALRRNTRLNIGLVQEGDYAALLEVDRINWRILSGPSDCVVGLDAISVDLRSEISDGWERRLADFALNGLPVYHSKHLLESLTGKVEIEHLSENSFGTLSPLHAYMSIKQALDMLIAFAGLVILSPVFALVALWVVLDSPGPAFFRQIRIGYQGKPFRVYKFRSMTVAPDQEPDAGAILEAAKTKNRDQRITQLGAFLRRSRIDELPQLLNVVRGEMSWIGPRPEAQVLSHWYEKEIPFYRYRHIVHPGITGWAQVNQGHVAEVSEVKSKLYYDFYYIKNFSPWIDLLIMFRTIRTMLTGFGSR